MTEYALYEGKLMTGKEAEHAVWKERVRRAKKIFERRLAELGGLNGEKSPYIYGEGSDAEMWLIDHPNGPMMDRIKHRLDGPATSDEYGKEWFVVGEYHRIGGPAIEHAIGYAEWYLFGISVRSYDKYQEVLGCSDEDIAFLKLKWGEMRPRYA